MSLPINAISDQLLRAVGRGNRVILVAPPGAGKSTVVPLMLLNQPWLGNQRLLLLEPRRLAARSLAERMAQALGEPVGETVGYRTRLDTRVGPRTRLEVITDGVLLRLLLDDPGLEGVGAVLFDEFHERGLGSDVSATLLLEVQESLRPDLRMLFMSATLPGERLRGWLGEAESLVSEGRSYPVDVTYQPAPARQDWLDHMAACLAEQTAGNSGSVLAFVPGRREIAQLTRRLAGRLPEDVTVMPLHAGVSPAQQRAAICASASGQRRLVLATSLAESAVTLDGVNLVVDAGWQRLPVFDVGAGMGRLQTRRLSRASADQRAGRAGRQGPGRCLRLWPRSEVLADETPVQIANADLMPLVLDLAAWGCRDPAQLHWLDAPPVRHWQQAAALLQSLGLIDARGGLTPLGSRCQPMPLHPRLARMVSRGEEIGCGQLAIKLALLLETPMPGASPDDTDVLSRLRWFSPAHAQDPRAAALQSQYRKLARGVGADRDDALAWADALLLAAFPDRLARRRADGQGRYLLRNGRGARLLTPTASEWLVVAEAEGESREMRIRLACDVSTGTVTALVDEQAVWEPRLDWVPDSGRFRLREQRMLGAISVEERAAGKVDEAALAAALLEQVAAYPERLPWTESLRQWQARVGIMRRLAPQAWPDVSDVQLMKTVSEWLAPYMAPACVARDLGAVPLQAALSSLLSFAQQQELERELPTAFPISGGRQVRIDYCVEGMPVLPVRLQEMFGQSVTPTLASGRIPLVLHLLSPARRPLAVTSDLASFWQHGYADVRKQMRGRYPKHAWPEDPLTAAAPIKGKR